MMVESAHSTSLTHTLREQLTHYIGQYLSASLLLGISHVEVRNGILIDVGSDYFVLQDPDSDMKTLCDLYTLKYLTAHPSGIHPRAAATAAAAPALPPKERETFSTTPKDGGRFIETSPQGLFRKLGKDARIVLPCPNCDE